MNLLSNLIEFPLLREGYEIGLNWIGQFARIIIEGVGIIGLGIVVFTLVLKAITLPFDIYQRVKMRKQNLIMREMQPELEKLQKQYANDKTTYNQKMLELQKKNGYSILGACLPMIISLVILIVAFQGFRTYSQYANLKSFQDMSAAYNAEILKYSPDGQDYRLEVGEDGSTTVVWTEEGAERRETVSFETGKTLREAGIDTGALEYTMERSEENGAVRYFFTVSEAGKFMQYRYEPNLQTLRRTRLIDGDYLQNNEETRAKIDALMAAANGDEDPSNDIATLDQGCFLYVVEIGSNAAAEYFRENNPGFLWVRNVWYPDVSYNHPIPSYSTFKSQLDKEVTFPDELDEDGDPVKRELSTVLDETQYNYLTRSLSEEKSQPNGYFILIVLSIGFMVLSQFLTMRSSKESNKYQTVDGQGATTQKVMLVVMPLIYAVFAFLYSAAFSIYMTMSSVISLCVTLLSNFILGRIFSKREEEAFKKEHTQVLPWMKKDEPSPKKEGKRKK